MQDREQHIGAQVEDAVAQELLAGHMRAVRRPIPEQRAYAGAKVRFDAAAADRARRLAPILDGDLEDGLDVRRQINEQTGYWSAYDALRVAENDLLTGARTWLRERPEYLAARPEYAELMAKPVPTGRHEVMLELALRLETCDAAVVSAVQSAEETVR